MSDEGLLIEMRVCIGVFFHCLKGLATRIVTVVCEGISSVVVRFARVTHGCEAVNRFLDRQFTYGGVDGKRPTPNHPSNYMGW